MTGHGLPSQGACDMGSGDPNGEYSTINVIKQVIGIVGVGVWPARPFLALAIPRWYNPYELV